METQVARAGGLPFSSYGHTRPLGLVPPISARRRAGRGRAGIVRERWGTSVRCGYHGHRTPYRSSSVRSGVTHGGNVFATITLEVRPAAEVLHDGPGRSGTDLFASWPVHHLADDAVRPGWGVGTSAEITDRRMSIPVKISLG